MLSPRSAQEEELRRVEWEAAEMSRRRAAQESELGAGAQEGAEFVNAQINTHVSQETQIQIKAALVRTRMNRSISEQAKDNIKTAIVRTRMNTCVNEETQNHIKAAIVRTQMEGAVGEATQECIRAALSGSQVSAAVEFEAVSPQQHLGEEQWQRRLECARRKVLDYHQQSHCAAPNLMDKSELESDSLHAKQLDKAASLQAQATSVEEGVLVHNQTLQEKMLQERISRARSRTASAFEQVDCDKPHTPDPAPGQIQQRLSEARRRLLLDQVFDDRCCGCMMPSCSQVCGD